MYTIDDDASSVIGTLTVPIGANWSNIWTLGSNKSAIECLCFDSEEQCVVSGSTNGSLKVFDLNEGKLARNLGQHPTTVHSIQYHPYGEFIVSGSADCTMKVWDVRSKTCIQTYNGHTKEVTCVRFSPDGKWVASSAMDGQILLWDLVAGKLIHSIKVQTPTFVRTFEFNPTEFTLAGATSMRSVKFWDLEVMEVSHHHHHRRVEF
jgi:katanin p80 WD40 repeat-containing subunit B1